MASRISTLFSLTPQEQESVEKEAGKLKSLAEFFRESAEALKENPVKHLLGHVGEVAVGWSGTAKALAKIVDIATKEHSAAVLGWLACTLAYREASERVIRQSPRPESRLPFSADLVRDRLAKLRLEDPHIMQGFSLEGATGHPFVRAADQGLWTILVCGGYSEPERRAIIRATRSAFTSTLRDVLTGEKQEKFKAFSHWLQLGTDDARVFATLAAHVEHIRAELEDQPALGIEPFAVDQVYIETECGVLPWRKIRGETAVRAEPLDAFAESSAPREDLMKKVLDLIEDPEYNDAIVVMGAPGAGKSTFTKKLAVRLHAEGFLPIRVPLQHLRVDLDLFDAVQDVLRRFAAGSFQTAALKEKVYSERLPAGNIEISPYIFIFDGWDEINLAADEGFQQRVDRLLDRLRQTLFDQNQNIVRVVLTGRPSQAIARSGFLRDETRVLTMRPVSPGHLRLYAGRLVEALRHPLQGPGIEQWKHSDIKRFEPALAKYTNEFPRAATLDVLGQPLLAHLAMRLLANFGGDVEKLIERPTTLYRHLTDFTCKPAAGPWSMQQARAERSASWARIFVRSCTARPSPSPLLARKRFLKTSCWSASPLWRSGTSITSKPGAIP